MLKATSIQVRDTSVVGGVRQTISTAELRAAQRRIEVEETNKKSVQAKREVAADSLQKYKLQILDLQNNSAIAGELGPLQYLSELTGIDMNRIINYLLLIIIFVFDPLAISLVVAANFAFDQANRKNLYGEVEADLWDDDPDPDDFPDTEDVDDWPRASQNHLDEWEIEEEPIVEPSPEPEPEPIKEAVPKKILQKGPSRHRVLFTDGTTRKIDKDDNIIRYL